MSALITPSQPDTQGHPLMPDRPPGKRPALSESGAGPTGSDAAGLLTPVLLSETERRFKFRGLPQAIGAARRALREWESHFDPDRFYDLSLCVSELVTSRVQRSGEGEIELTVRRGPGLVRAEVSDPREDVATALAESPLTTPGNWGTFIIDQVADRWGVDRSAGTRVWCEIDLAGSSL
jgi:anti-sigma regulatory factor (Ser/Thr protein kinase)